MSRKRSARQAEVERLRTELAALRAKVVVDDAERAKKRSAYDAVLTAIDSLSAGKFDDSTRALIRHAAEVAGVVDVRGDVPARIRDRMVYATPAQRRELLIRFMNDGWLTDVEAMRLLDSLPHPLATPGYELWRSPVVVNRPLGSDIRLWPEPRDADELALALAAAGRSVTIPYTGRGFGRVDPTGGGLTLSALGNPSPDAVPGRGDADGTQPDAHQPVVPVDDAPHEGE